MGPELDRARSRSLLLEKLNFLPRLVHPRQRGSVATVGASNRETFAWHSSHHAAPCVATMRDSAQTSPME